MKELTVYYSVRNGGDGSAYPTFMESMELAEWDQEHLDEGWGESCTGSISFESASDIITTDVMSKTEYFMESYLSKYCNEYEREEFVQEFYPEGLPQFTEDIEKEFEKELKHLRNL